VTKNKKKKKRKRKIIPKIVDTNVPLQGTRAAHALLLEGCNNILEKCRFMQEETFQFNIISYHVASHMSCLPSQKHSTYPGHLCITQDILKIRLGVLAY
jgi:hypothetical protein